MRYRSAAGQPRPAAAADKRSPVSWCELLGGARDVGGDDKGRVPVQAAAGPVVSHRGSQVSVAGGFLHVPRHGDERVP